MTRIHNYYIAHHITFINLSSRERNTTHLFYMCLYKVLNFFFVESPITSTNVFKIMLSLLPLSLSTLHALSLIVSRVLKILFHWLSYFIFSANKTFYIIQFNISSSSASNSRASSSFASITLSTSPTSASTKFKFFVQQSVDQCPNSSHQHRLYVWVIIYMWFVLLLPW